MKLSKGENYLNIPKSEQSKNIYRIFSVERLIELFSTKKLALVQPTLWDDPFENVFLNQRIKSKGESSGIGIGFRDQIYGQCWTFSSENDGMWRIYSPNGGGVKVKTNIRELYRALSRDFHFSYIGKVRYLAQKTIKSQVRDFRNNFENYLLGDDQGRNMVSTLLVKRKAFEHEREVRVLIFDAEKSFIDRKIVHVPIDPFSLITEISFDPRMNESIYEIYKEHLLGLGFNGKIIKSTLYNPPVI